jgi:hypothetical protein
MANWQEYIDLFPSDFHAVVTALKNTFKDQYQVYDYPAFAALPTEDVITNLASLNSSDPLLIAIAAYYLEKSTGIPSLGDGGLAGWELLRQGMPIDDLSAVKALSTFFEEVPLTFGDFQAMSTAGLAVAFADVHTAQNFWASFGYCLGSRKAILSDTEFGGFVLGLPLEERSAVESLLKSLVDADPGFDQAALLAMGSQELAGKIKSVIASSHFLYHSARKVITTARGLVTDHTPDDHVGTAFSSSQGRLMTAGLVALQKSLATVEPPATAPDIAWLTMDTLAGAISGWKSGHLYFHGLAASLLSSCQEHQRLVDEQARVPVTVFAFQIRPSNNDARPLGGLLVKVMTTDTVPLDLGTYMLDFMGIAYAQYEGPTDSSLELTFELMTADEESLVTSDALAFDPATENSIEVELAVPALPVGSDTLVVLTTALSLTIPSGLATWLAGEGIETLDDIRRMGGLVKETNTDVQENLILCQILDNHAMLEMVTGDSALRQFLINNGYTTASKIASKTRPGFVAELTGESYGEVTLAVTYLKASKVDAVLGHLVMAKGAGNASRYQAENNTLNDLFAQQCDCDECRSGVSPLAYLVALLDYGTKHLKDNGAAVDVDWFQETFHQGFCELPANCSSVEKKVCQVRIAIEVLRQYMGGVDIAYGYRKDYLKATYGLLLNQCGTTVEEIRLASSNPGGGYDAIVQGIADRVGIAPSHVEALFLDSTGISPSLTENNLELLFGFQSTLRNPYSDGLKLLDSSDKVQSWQFTGVEWMRNTDVNGYLHLLITPTAVELYKDSSLGSDHLVGWADVSQATPHQANIRPQNDSGLSGRIEMGAGYTYNVTTDNVIHFSVVPLLQAWRLARQRARWQAQDWPTSNTYFLADRALPFIEPDFMGPDDIRDTSASSVLGSAGPFDIWVKRRNWVDDVLADFTTIGYDMSALFDAVDAANWTSTYQEHGTSNLHTVAPWDSSSIPGFTTWQSLLLDLERDLKGGSPNARAAALVIVNGDLRLGEEGFARLVECYHKYLLEPSGPGFTAEELTDIQSILCQVAKEALYPAWKAEESSRSILLSAAQFWPPLHEPKEGRWNSRISKRPFFVGAVNTPLIDPVEVGLLDLPDAEYGGNALQLWQDRVAEINTAVNDIFASRTSGLTGFQEMLVETLGTLPTFLASPTNPFLLVADVLAGLDSTTPSAALALVETQLLLTEAEFREVAKVMISEEDGNHPSDAEYEALAKILVNAWRRKQWDTWEGLESFGYYWQARKQKLPTWRSSTALRRQWIEGLAFHSRTPMVDPDLIKPGDIVNPEFNNNAVLDNPAYVLWRSRNAAIEGTGGWMDSIVGDTFQANVTGILGVTGPDEIEALQVQYEQNKDVSRRLKQLNLDPQRLDVIVKIKRDLDNALTPSDAEMSAFHGIMLQVRKERKHGLWNIEEREAGISLSPEFFQIAHTNYLAYIQYLEAILLPWRSSPAARRDWQDRLESRIDQREGLKEGIAGMVKSTEDRVLILLRDALIKQSAAPGGTLEAKGEYLTEMLLMDFRTQCCNETTRVAQAIETLQVLYFSIRTGTILDDYPLLKMDADDWDDDWKWLGTYATWRSLMFVYLYPENVLLPSLKDKMTGKLAGIIDQVRSSARFTPDMACAVLHDYEDYLTDMSRLVIQATVTTTSDAAEDGCGTITGDRRELDFHFAHGGHTKRVYCSIVDNGVSYEIAQHPWEPVPEMEGIWKVIGATVFKTKSNVRYVYVFALKLVGNDQPDLCVNRLNLSTMRWDSDLSDLKIDKGSRVETWGTKLAEREKETDPLYIVGSSYQRAAVWSLDGHSVDLTLEAGFSLKDRYVLCNKLDSEGRAWAVDEWNSIAVLWLHHFELIGAMVTEEEFVCALMVVKFKPTDNPKLAWYTFYGGSKPMRRFEIHRLIPEGNLIKSTLTTVIPPPQSLDIGYHSYFNEFQWDSAQIRFIDLFPDYESTVGFVRMPATNGPLFDLHYCSSQGSITKRIEVQLRAIWEVPTSTYTYWFQYISGSPANALFQRSVLLAVMNLPANPIASNIPYSFIGPCHTYLDGLPNNPLNGSPLRLTRHLGVPTNVILSFVGAAGNLHYIALNLLTSLGLRALNEHPTPTTSGFRATVIKQLFDDNFQNNKVNLGYLEEAYYLLPVFLAIELQKNKHYEAALELFRLVYDYTLPSGNRKIYYGLVKEESIGTSFANVMAWLDNPENPHTIAGMRANTYTRFTIFSIVRCMLEMADQEFTADSPESVPRARTLYLAARELIKHEIYSLETEGCGALLDDLDAAVTDAGWYPEWLRLKAAIAAVNNHDAIDAIVNGFASYTGGIAAVFADTGLDWEEKMMAAEAIYMAKSNAMTSIPNRLCAVMSDWSISGIPTWTVGGPVVLLDEGETGTGMRVMSNAVGEGFLSGLSLVTGKTVEELTTEDDLPWLAEAATNDAPEALELSLKQRLSGESGMYEAHYEANPLAALRQGGKSRRPYIPYSNHYFCIPQNPVPFNLLLHAELNLFKIRHCRNIAGIHRELDPYGAPTDTTSGMPIIGGNGQISFPGTVAVPPTPYRYEVVLGRAKELVQLSAQAESAMLVTLEKLDAERYNLLRARQDLGTAKATVRLQDLRVRESEHEVDLAEMQQDRAQFQVENYQGWIDAGLPNYEQALLNNYYSLENIRMISAGLNSLHQILSDAANASIQGAALVPQMVILDYAILIANMASISTETAISVNQIHASFEQRKRDWTFQKAMGEWDVKQSTQQIKLANDRLRISGQERAISQMQADHAESTLEFLRTKFTNADLYDWMSGVLQRVYSFYLQHATSMAKVAQQQLAFERQESPANLIQDDYWSPPSDNANVPGVGSASSVDRKGLTGSARLQMDLTKLDLYSFETEKRKLQLSKTMSLAQLFPAEFEVFRQTGVLRFRTKMEWFDRDFPGHYLRLIKRVRTSVIALVPPGEGIRARLATTGVSRVVVGGDTFQTIVTRRGSESVSLTSPMEATGLFEMLPDRGDMLFPFEAMGVDAPWEFRMHKAANPINFSTIADVLITFEYTALESPDYESQVIQSFDNELHGERAFSFKYLFPDQWYDLRNALLTATPYRVDFQLRKGDLPGLAGLKVENVTVMVITKEVSPKPPRSFLLWKQVVAPTLGGVGTTLGGVGTTNIEGVVSTRMGGSGGLLTGNASNWQVFRGISPEGSWTLDLSDANANPSTPAESMQALLNDPEGKLEDILLIIGYRGESPGYVV